MVKAPLVRDAGAAGDPGEGSGPDGASERWSRSYIDLLPDLVAVVDTSGVLLYANAAAEEVLGYAPTTQVGRSMFELVHPDDLDSVTPWFSETVATPGPRPRRTFRIREAGGDWRHVETTAVNRLTDPSVPGIVINLRDVTDRVRAEDRAARLLRMYRVLTLANQAATGVADAVSLLQRVCDIAVEEGGFGLAWVGLLEGNDVVRVAAAGEPVEYVESLRISLGDVRPGPTASAIIGDRPVVVSSAADPVIAPWRDRFAAAGWASSCAVPIRQRDVVIGALNVYSSSPGYFDDEEVALLVELASDIASGLDRLAVDVDRAATEKSLQRSEERFRALVQRSTDAVLVLSPAATISFITPSVTSITGWPADHYVGTDALTWVHPDDHPVVVTVLDPAFSQQGQPRLHARISHRDGGWRWVEFAVTNMVDVPEVAGIVVNFHDTTTQREAEEQIRFQARLLDAVGEAVIATDLLGRILYWNDAATGLYGWSSEEVRGQLITEITPAVGSAPDAAEIFESLTRGETWAGVFAVRRRDGSEFEASVTDRPFFDEAGRLAGIIGTSVDVTEREVLNRRLLNAIDLLRGATDSMSEGMFVLDLDGRATLVNSAAAELLGGTPEYLLGQSMHDLTHFERADGSPLPVEECLIHTAFKTDQVVRVDRDTFVRLDGTRLAGQLRGVAAPRRTRRSPRLCRRVPRHQCGARGGAASERGIGEGVLGRSHPGRGRRGAARVVRPADARPRQRSGDEARAPPAATDPRRRLRASGRVPPGGRGVRPDQADRPLGHRRGVRHRRRRSLRELQPVGLVDGRPRHARCDRGCPAIHRGTAREPHLRDHGDGVDATRRVGRGARSVDPGARAGHRARRLRRGVRRVRLPEVPARHGREDRQGVRGRRDRGTREQPRDPSDREPRVGLRPRDGRRGRRVDRDRRSAPRARRRRRPGLRHRPPHPRPRRLRPSAGTRRPNVSPHPKNPEVRAHLQVQVDRELEIVDLEQAIVDREDAINDRGQAALDREQHDIDAREDPTPADGIFRRRTQLGVDRSQAALDAYQEALAVVQELRDRRLDLLQSEQDTLEADSTGQPTSVADLQRRAAAEALRAERARERASALAARADAAQRRAEAALRRAAADPRSVP